jgi:hypothetical protein
VKLKDPFGAKNDPLMPQLVVALDRRKIGPPMKRGLRKLIKGQETLRIKRIKVLRHKPGKRCVIEYKVYTDPPGNPDKTFSILGKIRANRSPRTAFELQDLFWQSGFDDKSADGISVPEPLGMIEDALLWFQRKVPGELATALITPTSGVGVARRVAEAAVKIHRANVPINKSHLIADELRILRNCFDKVQKLQPSLFRRIETLFGACEKIARPLVDREVTGIHRDFYSDQILVDEKRLFVLDFDLYCLGDPALDIGNFLGHLTEQALRLNGDPNSLRAAEEALTSRFLELTSPHHQAAIQVYALLTLARHIYLSTQFPDRTHLTEKLLSLCEERIQ